MYAVYVSKSFPEVKVKGRDLGQRFTPSREYVKLKTLKTIQDLESYLRILSLSLKGEQTLVSLKIPRAGDGSLK